MADNGETHLSFTGNSYIEHRVSVHHRKVGFLKLVELLKGSDLSFANLECAIQDGEDWPAFGSGMGWAGTYMGAPPSMIEELKFMGIKAVYAANNHVADFGELGILTTINYLKRGRMPYAGIGASLTEASQPTYLETENARVALIAAADWGPRQMMDLPFPWPAGYMPADELPPYKSRPGVNVLRYDAVAHVDRDAFEQLKRISQELEWGRGKVVRFQGAARTEPLIGSTLRGWEKDTDTEFFFMGRKFVLGEEFRMSTFAYQEDLDRTYRHVTEARRHADVVIVALHDQAHGVGVHDYINTFAHGCIDAGADIYINHGGVQRGIEFYKGKAIIYGQPPLYLQNDEVTKLPTSMKLRMGLGIDSTAGELLEERERSRERANRAGGQRQAFSGIGSAVHTVVFGENAELKEIRIRPTEEYIIHGRRPRLSVPRLAEPGSEKFNQVIERARERSKPFGTTIEIRDGIGVVLPK
ncbi:MAG: CapA family protein [Deltaproteobacteria bacterium]|nr:CapA family protein [Deltaproteobacteria bacterium]